MEGCKAQIDPVEFGEVKADARGAHKRVDGLDTRFDKVESKIDSVKWLVVANMVGGTGALIWGSEAKDVIIAVIGHLIKVTYAAL